MLKPVINFIVYLIALLIGFILNLFPIKVASNVGGCLALIIIRFHKSYRTAISNINQIFPNLTQSEVIEIADASVRNLGRNVAEFLCIRKLNSENYKEYVDVIDIYKFLEFHKQYPKVMIISAHFGNWEIPPKISSFFGNKFHLVYRHANNTYIDKLIQDFRSSYTLGAFNKSIAGSRALIRAIKENDQMILCILADQKMNNGILSNFLGHDAYTSSAPAELAIKYKIPIVMANITRIDDDFKFKINVGPFIVNHTEGNNVTVAELTQTINDNMGQWIIENPKQWFWVHNRWGIKK